MRAAWELLRQYLTPAPTSVFKMYTNERSDHNGWEFKGFQPGEEEICLEFDPPSPGSFTITLEYGEDNDFISIDLNSDALQAGKNAATLYTELAGILTHARSGWSGGGPLSPYSLMWHKFYPEFSFAGRKSDFTGFQWMTFMSNDELAKNGGEALLDQPDFHAVTRFEHGALFQVCAEMEATGTPEVQEIMRTATFRWAELNQVPVGQ